MVRGILLLLFICISSISNGIKATTDNKDSIFMYSPSEKDGMHIAIKNGEKWTDIGQLFASDYGPWGVEKKMYNPYIYTDGKRWYATWTLNKKAPCFAVAYSEDLMFWRPQDYPYTNVHGVFNVQTAEGDGNMIVTFNDSDNKLYKVTASKDFRTFSKSESSAIEREIFVPIKETVDGKPYSGQKFVIGKKLFDEVKNYFENISANNVKYQEDMNKDKESFTPYLSLDANGRAQATLKVNEKNKKNISDKLIGIFFEDISYAADGGLYAELIQNRDFEYSSADRKEWGATTAWESDKQIRIVTSNPLSDNNPHSVLLSQQTITNEGWDGISVKKDEKYNFSFFVNLSGCKKKSFVVSLHEGDKVVAKKQIKIEGNGWKKYTTTLVANATAKKARLSLIAEGKGEALVDMISLFPVDTYKGRENGLRKDLAEIIEKLQPKFVRFPGGCMSHGQGLDNIYHWTDAVGELQDRKPAMNIWHYHQTRGLGFYEYFLFCEDLGAEPIPVLAAGVPCQNSAENEDHYAGQQGGIPMEEMDAYCQEILNFIEWANGDPATSKWAKMRADAGHPESFNLKYIGIGNEDIISTVFEERFEKIVKVINDKYPEIKVIGTVGPFHYPSSDYVEGWDFAKRNKNIRVDLEDEHYYESPGWFLNNMDYYDSYDRKAQKVYLGEYASRGRTLQNALVEAMYLSNIERNGDIVEMASYAPLLAKEGHHNWDPDMIYFDNEKIVLTPSYEVQRLFSVYSGNKYLSSTLIADTLVSHRVAASIVENENGTRFLKITNALPVDLKITIEGLELQRDIKFEGISGKPSDKETKTVSGTTDSSEIILPAYSFRVFQL